jgi:hypothetical protein
LELEFFLRPTVSRPVRLGIGPPFGILDQILSCSSFVWQLRRSAINSSPLTRERACNLLYNCFWASPEQSHLSRSPTELTAISYCLLWDSPNLEGQVPGFISPRNRVAQLYPRALGSLSVAFYDSQGLRWKYSNPPPHGVILLLSYLFFIYILFLQVKINLNEILGTTRTFSFHTTQTAQKIMFSTIILLLLMYSLPR